MSGEELRKKLEGVDISRAEIARQLGVFPQSLNKTLQAQDVSSGLLESIAKILGKNMGFFYDIPVEPRSSGDADESLLIQIAELEEENKRLRNELRHREDPDRGKKESETYQLWMEYMRIEEMRAEFHTRMQEIYRKQMEG